MRFYKAVLTAALSAAVVFGNAPGVAAVDGVLPFPLEFHFQNGPNGIMVCPFGEFECGKGCCHDVSTRSSRNLGDVHKIDLHLEHHLLGRYRLLPFWVSPIPSAYCDRLSFYCPPPLLSHFV
jgi:hypothetical protein